MNNIIIAIAVLFASPSTKTPQLKGKWELKAVKYDACYYSNVCISYINIPGQLNNCDATVKGNIEFSDNLKGNSAAYLRYMFKCPKKSWHYYSDPEEGTLTKIFRYNNQFKRVKEQGKVLLIFNNYDIQEVARLTDNQLILKGSVAPNSEDYANLRKKGIKRPHYLQSLFTYERSDDE